MRTTVYFIRHAESLTNVDPAFEGEDCLSEKGLEQAILMAAKFKQIKVESIFTSKILRAVQTAKEIEKVSGLHSVVHGFLGERKGTFSASSVFSYTESFDDFMQRLESSKDLLESAAEKSIALVGHSIFLKSLTAYLVLGELFTEELLGKFEDALVLDNAGMSKLVFNKEKKKWRIVSWNDVGK